MILSKGNCIWNAYGYRKSSFSDFGNRTYELFPRCQYIFTNTIQGFVLWWLEGDAGEKWASDWLIEIDKGLREWLILEVGLFLIIFWLFDNHWLTAWSLTSFHLIINSSPYFSSPPFQNSQTNTLSLCEASSA